MKKFIKKKDETIKVGLNLSVRKKIPYLEEKIIKKNYLSLEFVGGCLWSRQNVSKWDDIEKCSLTVNKEVIKYDYKKMGKIKHFDWTMTYSIPYEDQIKKQKRLLRKSQYYEVEVDQEQIHFLTPLIYDKKENTLIVIEDLVEYAEVVMSDRNIINHNELWEVIDDFEITSIADAYFKEMKK